ncbi:MAG: CDP-alcohol phosphatidyltransferase family protein [Deltaproteobacteria bacterium]|nr:CDP-alcohol phosphatidyltransferase family protein [Deltaproteobacteria bacterium]MDL1960458.1 CDP-alcohol phosphatidyltransferase family protein [Deltaproteobacteria bacterium]
MINWSFSDWCRDRFKPYLLLVARFLGWLGLSPNMVSIIGLIAYGASGLVLGMGHPAAAGWLLAVFGPLDAVDGLLAREQGQVSPFGAFLDSTVDRYAEFFLFLGLMAYLMLHRQGGLVEAALVLAAMTGSLLVSYTRARAEALGFSCKVGVLTRFERLFLFAVGLIFGWIYPILVILAVFTHITALQRIIYVYRQSSD